MSMLFVFDSFSGTLGLDECLRLISSFRFTLQDIVYLKSILQLPVSEEPFFEWLLSLDASEVTLYAMNEGEVVFAREPLLRVSGPLAICQLLETTLLNLVNFPSLIATNASRMRRLAGPAASLLEFGLRRAQGPDGGISASKYAVLGGFDGSSNVLAGKLCGWDAKMVRGTQAHSFIMAHSSLADLCSHSIRTPAGETIPDFVTIVLAKRKALGFDSANEGELAAFIAYAQAFPHSTLCLVDTYDTLKSGVPNFLAVAHALHEIGWEPSGNPFNKNHLLNHSDARFNVVRDSIG